MSINLKIKNLVELCDLLPENERIIVDILRDIISAHIPDIKEKYPTTYLSFTGTKVCASFGLLVYPGEALKRSIVRILLWASAGGYRSIPDAWYQQTNFIKSIRLLKRLMRKL
ncbi:MAG: hypothetical protein IPF93_15425 [Saprospiraceae bacterium]|nr:hypothetical protein [Saprospiraceae bacterium]